MSPDLVIQSCQDREGNTLADVPVIALSEADLLENVSHTEEGQNLPALTFAKGNRTNSLGQCIISVPQTTNMAIVVFVANPDHCGIECHIDVSS